MSDSKSMQAVVFHGPRNISLQERPIPKIQNEADIIVKVDVTALCGSELHVYRGHQASQTGFIMGHEFAGTVVEAGSEVETFRVGDKVVVPFTVSCGNCFYCRNGGSARYPECLLFGTAFLDGGQAEYVRVPLADTTAIVAPATIADEALVLMADIFPTGYYAVKSGMEMLTGMAVRDSTIVVVGSGPVGLCAIVAAANLRPQRLLAIDSVKDRLGRAEKLGAKPLNLLDGMANLQAQVEAVTEGRGADLVIEAVGLSPALRTAFEIIPWSAKEAYDKNVRLQMGRCPVRSIFSEALELLEKKQKSLGFLTSNRMPLSEAEAGYKLFDGARVSKVIFKPGL